MPHQSMDPAVLVFKESGKQKKFVLAKDQVIIGRDATCDLVLTDKTISSRHARIFRKGARYFLEDLESSNGTRHNKVRVSAGKDRPLLRANDELLIGRQVIWFNLDDPNKTPINAINTQELRVLHVANYNMDLKIRALKKNLNNNLTKLIDREDALTGLREDFEKDLKDLEIYISDRFKEHIVLHEITQIICRILDIKELLTTALKLVIRVLHADRGFILLWDNTREELKTIVTHDYDVKNKPTYAHDFQFSRTIADACFHKSDIIMLNDAMKSDQFRSAHSIIASSIRSVVCIPLHFSDETPCGVIYLDSLSCPNLFQFHQNEFLRTFANQTVIALQNARLYTQAVTDDLTGLYNRKYIEKRMKEEVDRARRYGRPCSLILLDVDHFKHVNDKLGHLVGDKVLQMVAGVLTNSARLTDAVSRMGGEEFLILLTETALDGAVLFAERLRKSIETNKTTYENREVSITASFGVVAYNADEFGESTQKWLDAADKSMYQAKSKGRNQVVAYEGKDQHQEAPTS